MRNLLALLCFSGILALSPYVGLGQQISLSSILKAVSTMDTSKKVTSLQTTLLPQVLQTAIQNGILSATETGLNIQSSLFGIETLFNPTLKVDTSYLKYKMARNISFGGSIKLNNGNSINGFQTNFKWALLNRRDLSDITTRKSTRAILDTINNLESVETTLMARLPDAVKAAHKAGTITDDEYNAIRNAEKAYYNPKGNNYDTIRDVVIPLIRAGKIALDSTLFLTYKIEDSVINAACKSMNAIIQKGSLLTFSFTSDYINSQWDSLNFQLEFMHGLGADTSQKAMPWDIYGGVFYTMKQDTVSKQSLARQIASAKFGLNKVLFANKDGSYLLEALGTAEYDYILNGQYPTEQKSTLYANLTLTIHLSKSIYLPLELKYAPHTGNFLGFLSVKWDILNQTKKSQ